MKLSFECAGRTDFEKCIIIVPDDIFEKQHNYITIIIHNHLDNSKNIKYYLSVWCDNGNINWQMNEEFIFLRPKMENILFQLKKMKLFL